MLQSSHYLIHENYGKFCHFPFKFDTIPMWNHRDYIEYKLIYIYNQGIYRKTVFRKVNPKSNSAKELNFLP